MIRALQNDPGDLPMSFRLSSVRLAAVLAFASILSLAGLFAYEWAFVMAPQQIPNN